MHWYLFYKTLSFFKFGYVICHVVGVQRLKPIQLNHRIDHKCDVVIQNIIKEEAKIILWLDVTHSFTSLSFDSLLQPIIAAFTSLKVKLFVDNIILNNIGSTLFFANEIEVLQTGKKVIIEELGYLDPDLYKVHIILIFYRVRLKQSYSLFTSFTEDFYLMIIDHLNIFLNISQDDTFLCKTSIKQFNTRYEWWYAACPTCAKQMYKDPMSGEKFFGTTCKDLVFNQRSTYQKQLPSEFLRLIGQRKFFHLRRHHDPTNNSTVYEQRNCSVFHNSFIVYYTA
ncbi:hypothetical protein DVH24_021310 [Malus domestica]|uniref:Uncharacterized protein n=1 Tax=Malus domestica TaxID=3750 RepID=A0A498HTQ4_MALDO|nr:hypothetical protein DVH24_021310 [Malus domestica]